MPSYFLIGGSLINHKPQIKVPKRLSPESRADKILAHQAETRNSFALDRKKFCSSEMKTVLESRDAKAWGKIAESRDLDASTFELNAKGLLN